MSDSRRVLLSWSSGKDSAWCLHQLRQDPTIEVVGLLTVIDHEADCVPMHTTPRDLVKTQAERVNLPLHEVHLPCASSTVSYEDEMRRVLAAARDSGVTDIAFGDLFLADLRAAREKKMQRTGLGVLFPLWMRNTVELASEMVRGGLRARVTYVDTKVLPISFLGRVFDESFLADLPPGVDPCGEHGEFHSFAFAGPMFSSPIEIEVVGVSGSHAQLRETAQLSRKPRVGLGG
ncbi:MAG TPA: ATP-binding protein [Planctomycetota bacterium]|nr:ATP-binding protein [Planctomycetota bacterium]